jgi:small subunit ribosomal protein S16
MLKIRLTRRGKRNSAFFRLVVAEHTSPIKGKFLEALGFLNPHTKEKSLKEDRIKYWMEKGAQCSDSAHNLLVSSGIISGPKRAIKMKKKEVEEEKEEAEPEDGKKEEPTKEEASAEEKKDEKKEEKTESASTEKEEKTEEKKADEPKAEEAKEEVKEEKKEEPAASEGEEKKAA